MSIRPRSVPWIATLLFAVLSVWTAATAQPTLMRSADVTPAQPSDPLTCGTNSSSVERPTRPPSLETPNRHVETRRLLYVRVRFQNETGPDIPESDVSAEQQTSACEEFFGTGSYGTLAFISDRTPVFTLPHDWAYYRGLGELGGRLAIRDDALTLADLYGYITEEYNHRSVRFRMGDGGWGWSGYAELPGRDSWVSTNSVAIGILCHELGHNFGLEHAGFWAAPDDDVIGSGTLIESADAHDTMGFPEAGHKQFNAFEKTVVGWLPASNVQSIASSGTYRLYGFDRPVRLANQPYLYRIPSTSAGNDYLLDYRSGFTPNPWLANGIDFHWAPGIDLKTVLLDMTPGFIYDRDDSALVVGRTFSDRTNGFHVTPIAKGGTLPEWLDIVVNFGAFAGNAAPSVSIQASPDPAAPNQSIAFSASATDPDGDTLAYYWDFGNHVLNTAALNTPTANWSWAESGPHYVRCVVSDMKGGLASASVVVTVTGTPTTFSVRGYVYDALDRPVQGARVHNSLTSAFDAYRGAFTDSDGFYVITGLPAGSYQIAAVGGGEVFEPNGFTNPVTVGPDRTGIDFRARFFTISGHALDTSVSSGSPEMEGVTIQATSFDGLSQYTTVTDSSGAYALTDVRNTSYNFVATKIGYSFPSTVVVVHGADVVRDMHVSQAFVLGYIKHATVPVVVGIDAAHEVTSYDDGSGLQTYQLFLPAGIWNFYAKAPGLTIRPLNFQNPGDTNLGELNFDAELGTSHSISGTVRTAGQPLPGVVVEDGQLGVSTTDGVGRFLLVGAEKGSTFKLNPSLAGYSFDPKAIEGEVGSEDVTGQDFEALPDIP